MEVSKAVEAASEDDGGKLGALGSKSGAQGERFEVDELGADLNEIESAAELSIQDVREPDRLDRVSSKRASQICGQERSEEAGLDVNDAGSSAVEDGTDGGVTEDISQVTDSPLE